MDCFARGLREMTFWSCPSLFISAAPSIAASALAILSAKSNGAGVKPLLFQIALPAVTRWSASPVMAIASWSWGRATIRFPSSRASFSGG